MEARHRRQTHRLGDEKPALRDLGLGIVDLGDEDGGLYGIDDTTRVSKRDQEVALRQVEELRAESPSESLNVGGQAIDPGCSHDPENCKDQALLRARSGNEGGVESVQ